MSPIHSPQFGITYGSFFNYDLGGIDNNFLSPILMTLAHFHECFDLDCLGAWNLKKWTPPFTSKWTWLFDTTLPLGSSFIGFLVVWRNHFAFNLSFANQLQLINGISHPIQGLLTILLTHLEKLDLNTLSLQWLAITWT